MTLESLSGFVEALDRAGELVRVTQPVSVDRELCEIADRAMKQPGGGPALLFERPILLNGAPSAFPVGINLFGSMKRMAMSLGVTDLDAIGGRITELLEMKVPEGFVAKLSLLPKLLELSKFPPARTAARRPARRWCGAAATWISTGSPCSGAGPRMAARTSPFRW